MTTTEEAMLEELKNFLRLHLQFGGNTKRIYSYILRYGRSFTERISYKGLCQLGKIKECYLNAQRAAVYNRNLSYTEGWGYSGSLIPVDHAWLVYRGKVVDPTWERRSMVKGPTVYFGLRIPTDYITAQWLKTRTADNLLTRWLVDSGRVKLEG